MKYYRLPRKLNEITTNRISYTAFKHDAMLDATYNASICL